MRYETEALLLLPPPIENWVQPSKSYVHLRRMNVRQRRRTYSYWVPRVHILVERKLGKLHCRVEDSRVERGSVLNTDFDRAIRAMRRWIDLPRRVVTIWWRN